MPPLRARPSDIPLLASHFLGKYARENGKQIDGFSDEALAQLANYDWPGNVRELENAIERAVVVSKKPRIGVEDFATAIASAQKRPDGMPAIPGAKMDELERFAILKTLEHTGGSTSRAAEILGISPRTIQYRLQQYSDDKNSDGKK
jgi:DNA-binding NtrC family response regulator